ncbi:MAG: immunoglobulin domain-containing protein [Opitutaceae bacterium]|nr:immunoglobulin domain-containing protein [Opitutaceae bacterium]
MNLASIGSGMSFYSWPRRARQFAILAAAGLFATLTSAQNAISTYAGAALTPGTTDTAVGPATLARFNTPKGVAVDSSGNVYVADSSNGTIRKITAAGIVSTIATGLLNPSGVAVDTAGVVYIADTGHHTIVKVSGATVTTIAGSSGLIGHVTNGAIGAAARFFNPTGIAVNGAGTIAYVADTSNHVICRIDLGTGAVTTIAGIAVEGGSGTASYANGSPGTAATFNQPYAVALNAAGTLLFVADYNNHVIRQVDLASSNAVTTFSGTAPPTSTFGSSDSPPLFRFPSGVAVDSAGNVYVTEQGNNTIRKITSAGAVSTLAGLAPASGNADGIGSNARFNAPFGVAVKADGTAMYVGDSFNHTIRLGTAAVAPNITTQPASTTALVGGSATFTVVATGTPAPTYQWQLNGSNLSGATNATLTINPVATTSAGIYTVFVTNVAGAVTSSAATLTVNAAPLITNTQTTFSFLVGATASTFTVTATGSPAPNQFNVISGSFPTWLTLNSANGVISITSGQSVPTSAAGQSFLFRVRVSNGVGTPAEADFTLTVQNAPVISVQPVARNIAAGQSTTFSVTATGTPAPTAYQWYRIPYGGAATVLLNDLVTYSGVTTSTLSVSNVTNAMNGDQFYVIVDNGVGQTTSSFALLTVAQAPTVFYSAASTTFVVGQVGIFTFQANGTSPVQYNYVAGTFPSWLSLNTTTGVLTSNSAVTADQGGLQYQFTVRASNSGGNFDHLFTLIVSATPIAPVITTQPQAQAVGLGQNATFTVVAAGSPSPGYQWQRYRVGDSSFAPLAEGGNYSGTNTATLTITNVTSGMSNDLYQVIVTNINGTTTSNSAQLTIALGSVFSTFAGQAGIAGWVDDTGIAARFRNPSSITVDSVGNAYVADAGNHVIRKISPTGLVTTLAGSPGAPGSVDGLGSAARFNTPNGVAVDASLNVYVADSGNNTIRMVTAGGSVTTLAGTPLAGGNADGVGSAARFLYPTGIAVDIGGTLYVSDTLNHTIRRISGGTLVTTIAGSPGSLGNVNGTGAGARFSYPNGLAVDTAYNIYVADTQNHLVRKITAGGVVTTLAGIAGTLGSVDGGPGVARFFQPQGVALDTSGNVYVADTLNHLLRRISPAGDVITLAGLAGAVGSADGSGNTVRFYQPYGVALDTAGNIYVADTLNHTIRRSGGVTAPAIVTSPQNQVAAVGGSVTFTASASGSPSPSYQWQRRLPGTDIFVNVSDGATYIGTATAALTILNVTSEMNGNEFRVVASNLVNPPATSSGAILTVGTPPTITSAANTTFRVGQAGTFTVTTSSGLPVTFSATGMPSWLTLNASSGVLSGTPPDLNGSPFAITITANTGSGTSTAATQSFLLTVEPSQVAPTIATQPASTSVNSGDSPTFSVSASGTAPLSYQWRKDGSAISGATGTSYTVTNAQGSSAGLYSVVVSNPYGTATSFAASLSVNTPPIFDSQPRAQTVLAGNSVTFSANVSGASGTTFQWRRNGVALAGANSSTLTLSNVSAADAGNYDLIVTNALGSAASSVAQLTLASAPALPVFTLQPASRTVVVGGNATFNAAAAAAPAATYQWRKNGVNIAGATNPSYSIVGIQPGDGGSYDVAASNSMGTVVSTAAGVRVIARSYAGIYFGSFGGGLGNFALYVRADNSGVFLGYLPGSSAPVMSVGVAVNDAGEFTFNQGAITASAAAAGEPARAAALNPVTVNGQIASNGAVVGSVSGGVSTSLSGARSSDTGASQNVAGLYQAGATNSGAVAYTIAGATGQAFALVQSGNTADGGLGSVNSVGQVAVATGRSAITETIVPSSGANTVTVSGGINVTLTGASETVLANQRLLNISSRARVGSGDTVAIAGFVISGEESKPVLIRAVGPTLGQPPFSVPGTLGNPRLELFRGSTSIGTNTGVGTSTNSTAIASAAQQIGAFALGNNDSAIFTTLAPGNYTAIVSSATTNTGVVLVEVYDLSAAAAGQKLLNISTRATAGSAENTLIAGVVVSGSAPKRVLIRAVGPGLAAFGVTGVLAQPTLTLYSGSQAVAANTGWTTSADATAIPGASLSVGAFGLTSQDSAIIVTFAPGNYTAQVTGPGTATGVALIEVYELP